MGQKLVIAFAGFALLGLTGLFAAKNYSAVRSENSLVPTSTPTTAVKLTPIPTTTPTPTKIKPQPTKTPLLEYTGPDGKVSKASKKDCDNINAFWQANTPQVNHGSTTTNSNSNSSSTPSTNPTSAPTAVPSGITVSTTSVSVTLSRANAQYGLIYGSGFTVTSIDAGGFQVHYTEGTQGQGFNTSSGGMVPGSSSTIQTYINGNKPNGTFSGSAVIEYYKNGTWQSGPTVSYSITLID